MAISFLRSSDVFPATIKDKEKRAPSSGAIASHHTLYKFMHFSTSETISTHRHQRCTAKTEIDPRVQGQLVGTRHLREFSFLTLYSNYWGMR